jgi:hypothetical protein
MTDDPKRPGILPMDVAVLNMARRFGLLRADGTAKCIHDECDDDATFPTLECKRHVEYRKGAR